MTADLWFAIFRDAAAGTSIVSHIDNEANIDKHIERMLAGGFCTLVRKMRVDELPTEGGHHQLAMEKEWAKKTGNEEAQ